MNVKSTPLYNEERTETPPKNEAQRSGSIDVVKGITILLVIMGHATGNLDTPLYRLVIYSFHMPLFFMISGAVLRVKDNYTLASWKQFIEKNFMALMVPYFLWGVLYSQFSYQNMGRVLYGSWEALGKAGTLTSLWFLPCLFAARVIAEGLFTLFSKFPKLNSRLLGFLCGIAAFATSFLLPAYPDVGYFWCLNVAFNALGFLLLGFSARQFLGWCYTNGNPLVYFALFLLNAGVFYIGTFARAGELSLVLMCGSSYGNLFYFFLNAVSGSFAVLFLSMIISDLGKRHHIITLIKKGLIYIGMRTFGIFILHKPFLQEILVPLMNRLGYTADNVPAVLVASLAALAFSCLALWVINKFIPQLMGRFPDLISHKELQPIKEDGETKHQISA